MQSSCAVSSNRKRFTFDLAGLDQCETYIMQWPMDGFQFGVKCNGAILPSVLAKVVSTGP